MKCYFNGNPNAYIVQATHGDDITEITATVKNGNEDIEIDLSWGEAQFLMNYIYDILTPMMEDGAPDRAKRK